MNDKLCIDDFAAVLNADISSTNNLHQHQTPPDDICCNSQAVGACDTSMILSATSSPSTEFEYHNQQFTTPHMHDNNMGIWPGEIQCPSLSELRQLGLSCFVPNHSDKLEKLDMLRSFISERFPEQYQRPFTLYQYFQEILNGRPVQEAAYLAGLVANKSPQTVIKWRDEFNDLGMDYFSSVVFSRTVRPKRSWLLEDYPHLLQKAAEWVNEQMRISLEQDGRLFRIIDFQKWVNTDLISDLIASDRVSPISHSTARSWLHRFGYYDEQRKLEDDRFKLRQEYVGAGGNSIPGTSVSGQEKKRKDVEDQSRVTRSRSKTWSTPNSSALGIALEIERDSSESYY